MSRKSPSNVAASVQQRLLNKSRKEGEDYQLLLTRFALERFLYRLGLSRHKEKFILKGAMLFPLWGGELHLYPRELVVAEKYHALVVLGIANSRMKDFYDLWILARTFSFDGEMLSRAIETTFNRRHTPIPTEIPMGLSAEFCDDPGKQTQWRAFLRKGRFADEGLSLGEVVTSLRASLCRGIRKRKVRTSLASRRVLAGIDKRRAPE